MFTPQYLDAGSASMIVQMIGGGVVAAVVGVKMFWGRILRLLHLRTADPDPRPESSTETSPAPDPSPR